MIDLEAIRARAKRQRDVSNDDFQCQECGFGQPEQITNADVDALIAEVERLRAIGPVRCQVCLWNFERQESLALHLIKGTCPGYAHTPITDFNASLGQNRAAAAVCNCGWWLINSSLENVQSSFREHLP